MGKPKKASRLSGLHLTSIVSNAIIMASFGAWQNLFHQTVGHTAMVATLAVTAAHARGLLVRCANNTLLKEEY